MVKIINEAEDLNRYEFLVKRYGHEEDRETITAISLEDAEDQLNSDGHVEYWDYLSDFNYDIEESYSLEESLNEDTQLKFDDDMINDIEVLHMWRPEEVERILIKHGSDKNNDNWIDGLDLPAAYDEIMSTFKDKYSDDDEIDYDVAKVLGLVEESLSENWRDGKFTKEDLDNYISSINDKVDAIGYSLTKMAEKYPEFSEEFLSEVKAIRNKFDHLSLII